MKYTAHPLGKKDGLPQICIFDEDGECVTTLTMDDIALLYHYFVPDCVTHFFAEGSKYNELVKRLQKGKEK